MELTTVNAQRNYSQCDGNSRREIHGWANLLTATDLIETRPDCRRRSSAFGGKTYLPENICRKINKMPEFYMIFARKKYFSWMWGRRKQTQGPRALLARLLRLWYGMRVHGETGVKRGFQDIDDTIVRPDWNNSWRNGRLSASMEVVYRWRDWLKACVLVNFEHRM